MEALLEVERIARMALQHEWQLNGVARKGGPLHVVLHRLHEARKRAPIEDIIEQELGGR